MPQEDRYKNLFIFSDRIPWIVRLHSVGDASIDAKISYDDLQQIVTINNRTLIRLIPLQSGMITMNTSGIGFYCLDNKSGWYLILDDGVKFLCDDLIKLKDFSQEYLKRYFDLKAFW
jgi:hypothetical protein